ncbi:hypothetical protein KSI01_23660 [Kurthia sibirica]|nr:hypothetical protein KSI01_23660 [Kurthia sibirica]
MVKYPIAYNPIIEYYNKMESGKIVEGFKVKRIYKKLVDNIYEQNSPFEYRPERANHALEFVENYCKHSKGKWGGKSIELELWHKGLIASAFGFVSKSDGTRKLAHYLFYYIN